MSPDEAHRLELLIVQGFAAVRGDINLLANKEQRNASDILDVDQRVTRLEERRFPIPTIGGIMGVAGVIVSLYAVAGKG